PLDFFVVYSSISGVLGNPGQSNYAAANTALDGLVRYRRSKGLPASSIQWGPWADVGMAANMADDGSGMGMIAGEIGMSALEHIIAGGEAVTAVVEINWPVYSKHLPGIPPSLKALAVAGSAHAKSAMRASRFEQEVKGMSDLQRQEQLAATLLEVAQGVAADDSLALDQPLMEAGLDSLAMTEFRRCVQERLGLGAGDLPVTVFFDYPSVAKLSTYLDNQLFSVNAPVGKSLAPFLTKTTTAVAIVGMACRFPGSSPGAGTGAEAFWDMLASGTDAISEIPYSRWDVDAFYDSNPDALEKGYARHGGFIEGAELFDNTFFGISAAEAKTMDPQQRLMLEVGYEALHSAGLSKQMLAGSRTGVFVGCCTDDYSDHVKEVSAYTGTGNSGSMLSNRVSYVLDMNGPSQTINTACSSSLVALHSACRSLQHGECDTALVGGVALLSSPVSIIVRCKAQMLAPDGHCKVFDELADGYVQAEGCGAVILKSLDQAKADGDNILAIVKGSAVGHNGRSASLTAPSGTSQQIAIRSALQEAGVMPEEVSYVETHGTGTALGDPIEFAALKATYGLDRDEHSPLILGAVKTNIGHLEGAAGIAGLVKAVLVLQHQAAPPNLHLNKPNPKLDLEDFPVVFPSTGGLTALSGSGRYAGLSSFGFGGANAHLILEASADLPDMASTEGALYTSRKPFKWRAPSHALLQRTSENVVNNMQATCFTCQFGPRLQGLLSAIKLNNCALLPGFGCLDAAASAFKTLSRSECVSLHDVKLHQPLSVQPSSCITTIMYTDSGRFEVRVCQDDERMLAEGICQDETIPASSSVDLEAISARCSTSVEVDALYSSLSSLGWKFGPKFRRIESIAVGDGEALALVKACDPSMCEEWELLGFGMHPAVMESAMQSISALCEEGSDVFLPAAIGTLTLTGATPGTSLYVHTQLVSSTANKRVAHIRLIDLSSDVVLMEVQDLSLSRIRDGMLAVPAIASPLYTTEWQHCATPERRSPCESVLVLGEAVSGLDMAVIGVEEVGGELGVLSCLKERVWDRLVYVVPVEQDGSSAGVGASAAAVDDLLTLVRCLATADPAQRPPLCVVTQGVFPAGPSGAQADMWQQRWVAGMLRTARIEYADLTLCHLDIDEECFQDLGLLLECFPPTEPEVAIRHGEWYLPRVVQSSIDLDEPCSMGLVEDGTYIISGGLGALGLLLARHMIEEGAGHLLLLSRSGKPKVEVQDVWNELQELSSTVKAAACDVSDAAQVQSLTAVLAAMPPVRGVVHAAGVTSAGMIADHSAASFEKPFSSKVDGAWNLHGLSLSEQWPLDFFLAYSSLASVLGDRNSSSYAAANAALDGFVEYRKSAGLPATSIQWGPWVEAGMAAGAAGAWSTGPMRGVSSKLGNSVLGPIIQSSLTEAIVVDVDWPEFSQLLFASKALLQKVAGRQQTRSAGSGSRIAKEVAGMTQEQRKEHLARVVLEVAQEVCADDQLGLDQPLMEAGLDSLALVEFRRCLQERLGLGSGDLPVTVFFDHPSVAKLSDFLEAQLFAEGASAVPRAMKSATRGSGAIAIVGMACRFPGRSSSPEAFWGMLASGTDGITEIPHSRWDVDAFYDPDPDVPQKGYARHGGFIEGAEMFDNTFFGISAAEAKSMDPQQRLMLEVGYEALHHVGYTKQSLAGSDTGVFVGCCSNDFVSHVTELSAYTGTGTSDSMLSNRVSYVLDINGPSQTIDTACSSSQVAAHSAFRSIQLGECSVALVGGVALLTSPVSVIARCKAQMLAPDGHCKVFDESADGYVPAEGCGAVILKSLDQATADGDKILAVIKGSAV
ncbi:unnamed protein product, partial [Chrysoparadoxa australica]